MFNSDVISAIRNLKQNKAVSILNLVSLAIGISAFLIIFLVVNFELGFDRFQPDRACIYRVYTEQQGETISVLNGAPSAVFHVLRSQITGIDGVTNFFTFAAPVSISNNNAHTDMGIHHGIMFAGPDYFSVFNYYEWIIGDPENSLSKPFGVVLTESRAKSYFSDTNLPDLIGREIRYADSLIVNVTGIVKDVEGRTDFDFTEFISFSTIERSWLKSQMPVDSWNSVNSYSQLFIKLSPRTSVDDAARQVSNLSEFYRQEYNRDWNYRLKLQPLADLHFNPSLGIFDHSRATFEISTLYILISLATLLLLIGIINYISLVTAQASGRVKEVGIKKILGASRTGIIGKFLLESLLLTSCALALSICLVRVIIQYLPEFIPPGLEFDFGDRFLIIFLFGFTVAVTFLAGLYPAFVLSSGPPLMALKNQFAISHNRQTPSVRKALTICQLSITQVLIFVTLTMTRQMDFMLNKDLGFSTDALVYFSLPRKEEETKKLLLKNELQRLPQIEAISMGLPPAFKSAYATVEFLKDDKIHYYTAAHITGDTNYLRLYNIHLLAGRNFLSDDLINECLINETLMHRLGFHSPSEALGQILDRRFIVTGVVKDFHIGSLHSVIDPVILHDNPNANHIGIKLAADRKGSLHSILQKLEDSWKMVYPDTKFECHFLNMTIERLYETEKRTRTLATIATGIAILISSLGLFGLSIFTISVRTKEIGIRKVMGATTHSIALLLSKDFLKLVLIAVITPIPLAYYLTYEWLSNFVYRINPGAWTYMVAGLLSITLVLITISFRTMQAASDNPVKTLRHE